MIYSSLAASSFFMAAWTPPVLSAHTCAGTEGQKLPNRSKPGRGTLGQAQSGALGTSLGMGRGRWPVGGPGSAQPMDGQDRAVVGLEMCPMASVGQGLMAPWAGMGSWAVGRRGGAPGAVRDIRAHARALVLTENAAAILGQYLLPIFCGNPRAA